MNYSSLIQEMEALLSVNLKMADRHDLDSISISTARARQFLLNIRSIKKEASRSMSKHIRKEPAWLSNPD
jgi:hypothetical protein